MATRADFYTMSEKGEFTFIGSTSNSYYGDFEKATNIQDYLKSVRELLRENNSIEGKWYWPWKNSHISDEVFVFKNTPKLLNKNKGILLTKVHVRGCEETHLNFIKYTDRSNENLHDENGYFDQKYTEKYLLPIMQ